MATLVGTQTKFEAALKDLLELEYDALEAYEAAVVRLTKASFRQKLEEFMADHKSHIQELTQILKKHEVEPPTGPSGKKWLTKGKVVLADLVGDSAILAAMKSNEVDTNTAYERIHKRTDQWQDAQAFIERAFADEKKHHAWLTQQLNT